MIRTLITLTAAAFCGYLIAKHGMPVNCTVNNGAVSSITRDVDQMVDDILSRRNVRSDYAVRPGDGARDYYRQSDAFRASDSPVPLH